MIFASLFLAACGGAEGLDQVDEAAYVDPTTQPTPTPNYPQYPWLAYVDLVPSTFTKTNLGNGQTELKAVIKNKGTLPAGYMVYAIVVHMHDPNPQDAYGCPFGFGWAPTTGAGVASPAAPSGYAIAAGGTLSFTTTVDTAALNNNSGGCSWSFGVDGVTFDETSKTVKTVVGQVTESNESNNHAFF